MVPLVWVPAFGYFETAPDLPNAMPIGLFRDAHSTSIPYPCGN